MSSNIQAASDHHHGESIPTSVTDQDLVHGHHSSVTDKDSGHAYTNEDFLRALESYTRGARIDKAPRELQQRSAHLADVCGKCGRAIASDEPIVKRWDDLVPWGPTGRRPELIVCCTDCGNIYTGLYDDRLKPSRDCWHCGRRVYRSEGPWGSRYCCHRCAWLANNQQRKEKKVKAAQTCQVCGIEMTESRSGALTCSPACRQKAYRQRRAAAPDPEGIAHSAHTPSKAKKGR